MTILACIFPGLTITYANISPGRVGCDRRECIRHSNDWNSGWWWLERGGGGRCQRDGLHHMYWKLYLFIGFTEVALRLKQFAEFGLIGLQALTGWGGRKEGMWQSRGEIQISQTHESALTIGLCSSWDECSGGGIRTNNIPALAHQSFH